MSTLKTYTLDTGDTTNLVIKTNGTTALTVNGSTQAITTAGAFTSGSTVADSTATLRPLVSATSQASTSGTAIDFSSIPSWVKRITVMFNGVSTSGTSPFLIQIGTSGGIVNTGYNSYGAQLGGTAMTGNVSSAGFLVGHSLLAASVYGGNVQVCNVSGNIWSASGMVGTGSGTSNGGQTGAGNVSLSGTLDRVRITTVNGTDTFDAGSINIMYE